MFNLPMDSADALCPDCRRPMVELAKMRRTAGDAYMTDGFVDNITYGQARRGQGAFILFELIDFTFEAIYSFFKRRKMAKLCAAVLPVHPKSLVCPQCLFVLRR